MAKFDNSLRQLVAAGNTIEFKVSAVFADGNLVNQAD